MGFLNYTGLERLWNHVCSKFNELSAQISSLTATDVGAMQATHAGESGDFNALVNAGCYRFNTGWTNGPSGLLDYGQVLVIRGGDNSDTLAQIAFNYAENRAWVRTSYGYYGDYTTITWMPWKNILTSGEILVVDSQNYGSADPGSGVEGQIYFKKV